MSRGCSFVCSGLFSAGILISAGVIQIIAGIILLKSKFVYLLSGPNFWTAAANISVGSLIGVSSSVWQKTKEIKVVTYITRYHLIVCLHMSCIIINVTTAAILILGEGNSLLTIYLEQDAATATNDVSLITQLLGYAYATSAITPVVCATVALLSIIIGCCPSNGSSNPDIKVSKKRSEQLLSNTDSALYSWVFSPRSDGNIRPELRLSSSSCSPLSSSDLERSTGSPSSDCFSPWSLSSATRLIPKAHIKEKPLRRVLSDGSSPHYPADGSLGNVVPIKVSPSPSSKSSIPVKSPIISSEMQQTEPQRLEKITKSNFGTYTVVRKHKKPGKFSLVANDERECQKLVSFKGANEMYRLRKEYCREFPVLGSVTSYRKRLDFYHGRPSYRMESITENPFEDRQSSNKTFEFGRSPSDANWNVFVTNTPPCMFLSGDNSILDQDVTTPKRLCFADDDKAVSKIGLFHQGASPNQELRF